MKRHIIDRLGCSAVILLYAVSIALAVWLITGCTATQYVPVESVHTEREYVDRWRVDTLMQSDTRIIYVKGDTVIDRRDRWRERIKEVHDTMYIERTDSIPMPYPVERELSWWEQAKIDYGGAAICIVACAIIAAVVWLARKFRR